MPIAGVSAPERPKDTRPGQARFDVRVVANIARVIQVDELVSGHRPIARQGHQGEQRANGQDGWAFVQRAWGGAAGFCFSSSICCCRTSGWGEAFLESSRSSMARGRFPSFSSKRERLMAI